MYMMYDNIIICIHTPFNVDINIHIQLTFAVHSHVDGLVLSAQGSAVRDYFIPRDSFITDSSLITSGGSSAVVACRSTNRNPMWSYPNGTAVTTVTTVNVYQNIRNNARSDLIIGDVSTFTNGDYTCTGTFTGGSISAVLGLYIMSGEFVCMCACIRACVLACVHACVHG